ncbi:hypothetical protein PBRA_002237 [Plasmodiophora brassicae]|uniref:UDENN domain-containing protein n=1 Tax=Plasmodiophora brassicae TaxID=37360 RepID=A0A0G4J371_PLABS|nr:hypothetical protein PBRA_002237 [Plasmodiophora brassicae]
MRWREAIQRIIALRKLALEKDPSAKPGSGAQTTALTTATSTTDADSQANDAGVSGRLVDYFIVFGVHPPKEFEKVNFSLLSEEQIESVLRRAQVFAGIVDRYPREDYKDCPVSDVWTSLAFPTGILLSWVRRQPKSHFAVVTFQDGRKCFLTFLQFDQPMSELLDMPPSLSGKELYTPKAICLVSQYPHLSTFRKMLSQLYSVASTPSCSTPVERFIAQITLELPLPIPEKMGISVMISDPGDPVRLSVSPLRDPLTSRLPLRLLFDILGVDSILGILSAMIFEQRILLHSNSLSALTIVCQTMLQVFYPFQWSSVYVPVLAELMLDAYQCPQPYIQGVHTKYLAQFTELNDIVLVDLDHDVIRCSSPLPRLPQIAGGALWTRLGEVMERMSSERDNVSVGADDPYSVSASSKFDREVTTAFLTFYADLCSGFRRFLFFINDVPFFNGSGFLKSKNLDEGAYNFLAKVIESRAFDGFLEQESEPSLYNDFLATGNPEVLLKIHEIESRSVEHYQLTPPKPVPGGRMAQAKHAFAKPLRQEYLNAGERVRLSRPLQNAMISQSDQIQYYMSRIFANEGLNEKDVQSMAYLLQNDDARQCLASILRQPQAKGPDLCLSDSSFESLAATLQTMLQCCHHVDDYVNATGVLDAATKFFCEDDNGDRVFIESAIRDHPIWNRQSFWESFMQQAMSSAPARPDKREDFVVDWLMNAAHRMLTYRVAGDDVLGVVQRLCSQHNVPESRVDELRKLVRNAEQALAID